MTGFQRAASIEDLRVIARNHLPRFVFDFLDGACESENGMLRNSVAFQRLRLIPRYLIKVDERSIETELFGRKWGAPFGIAPTGLAGLIWPTADLDRARAAKLFNVPFLLSTASSHTIEEIGATAADQTWFQMYAMRDWEIVTDLLHRCTAAGISTLVLTVDLPVHGKRERDIRNGFSFPLRLTMGNLTDFVRCPVWSLKTLQFGLPRYVNFDSYFPEAKKNTLSRTAFLGSQAIGTLDWKMLERLRSLWPGRLILKGLMSPDDVRLATERAIDGIILSNHGGRQLDSGPATIEMLPAAIVAAGDRIPVMLDSGIRRGADIVRAIALGAAFTFVGRAPLYGLAAGRGQQGVEKALAILADEVTRALGQIGCNGVKELGSQHIFTSGW